MKPSDLVKLFVELKTKAYGRKNTTKGLSELDTRKLKKLAKRYEPDDFTLVINEMLKSDFIKKNPHLANLTHVLVESNFDRYYSIATDKEEERKQLEEEARQMKQLDAVKVADVSAAVIAAQESAKFTQECRQKYSESLKVGKWLGTPPEAARIGVEFAKCFTPEEKKAMYDEVTDLGWLEINTDESRKREAVWKFSQRVVEESVKRKIVEPWINNC